MKNFLLFDSLGVKNSFVIRLAKALEADGLAPIILTKRGSETAQLAKENNWTCKYFWQPLNRSSWLAIGSLWFYLQFLVRFLVYKKLFGLKTLVCLGEEAKLLATRPAKLLGLKIVWLELPNFRYDSLGKNGLKLYCALASWAKLICFSLTTKLALLALGVAEDGISLIWPGIEQTEFQSQVNLFQSLAKQNYLADKQFFTIGTIIDLAEPQRSEVLMRAIQASLEVVPRLRLIIIGDGEAREQAQWLSKKLHLESVVWLVGSQTDLKKWYANFDLFIVASATPGLDDFVVALGAMINGVPVIAPQGLCLEDCFLSGNAGVLLSLDDAEELATTIIKLQQDDVLRKNLSANAKRVAKDFFDLSRAKEEFKLIIS